MKKLVLSIIAIAFTTSTFAQKAFDKYIDSDNVGTLTINKSMLGIVASMSANEKSKEARDFIDLAENINEIKIYISENRAASVDMKQTVKSYLRKSSMEELMRVRDEDAQVDFYVKSTNNDNVVSQLFMFVTGIDNKSDKTPETVLVTMNGKIELDKIGALVNKMQLHPSLKKASEKSK
ncbi:DUF4252 domain-containing protein [uncultured Croceitalea sp.]|uniref:DUF4252 domain-containing protein n=1 Tax=uncultured Croceitalea sp. TaxID=1798908 RepID=UPI003305DD1F